MTEQTKIPTSEAKPAETGHSLFERASGAFSLDSFTPAKTPRNLPQPPAPRARPAAAPSAQVVAPAPIQTPAPVQPVAATMPQQIPVEQPAAHVETAPIKRVPIGRNRVSVDRIRLQDNGMIVPGAQVSALLEEFRILKRELLGDAREQGTAAARRILVCSPHPNEGKTFCAVNLALAMAAERDIEVVLVDADFANPSVPAALGITPTAGLMDALADRSIAPEDLVLATDVEGLFVLPSGDCTTSDSEFLASDRTHEVLERLTVGAPNRILVFDSPPALAASPAAELAKHVGQALLVARADVTGQSALEDACQLLSSCPDIKLCLNATFFSPSGRSFGSYEGYGSR